MEQEIEYKRNEFGHKLSRWYSARVIQSLGKADCVSVFNDRWWFTSMQMRAGPVWEDGSNAE